MARRRPARPIVWFPALFDFASPPLPFGAFEPLGPGQSLLPCGSPSNVGVFAPRRVVITVCAAGQPPRASAASFCALSSASAGDCAPDGAFWTASHKGSEILA